MELQLCLLAQSLNQDIHVPAHDRVPVAVLLVELKLFIVVVVSICSVAAAVADAQVALAESHHMTDRVSLFLLWVKKVLITIVNLF